MTDTPGEQNREKPMHEIMGEGRRRQKPFWATRSALFEVLLFTAGCARSYWISVLQHATEDQSFPIFKAALSLLNDPAFVSSVKETAKRKETENVLEKNRNKITGIRREHHRHHT